MKLHLLELGGAEIDKGVMLTPGIDEGLWVWAPIPAYLLETDGGERVLIDCGLHPGHIEEPGMTWGDSPLWEVMRTTMTEEHTVEHQLDLIGCTVDDVTHVVLSHLHYDHCGQLERFVDRPVFVSGRHLEAVRGDETFPSRYYDIPGIDWVDTDGERELFGGLEIVETPGHAPFHRSFVVSLPDSGTLVLAIDAVLSHHQVESDSWADQDAPDAAYASAHRLLALAEERNARVLYGHDPDQWHQLGPKPRAFS